jgi:hypothetical protein
MPLIPNMFSNALMPVSVQFKPTVILKTAMFFFRTSQLIQRGFASKSKKKKFEPGAPDHGKSASRI